MHSGKYYKKLLLVSRLIVSLVFLAGIETVWANGELCNPEKILDRLFEDGKDGSKLLGANDEDSDSVNSELLGLLNNFGKIGSAKISDRLEIEDCTLEFEIDIKNVQVFKITEDNETNPDLPAEERRKETPLAVEEGMSLADFVFTAMLFNNSRASAAKKKAKTDDNDFIKFKTTQKGVTSQIKRLLSFETPIQEGDCSTTQVKGSFEFHKGFRTIVKGTNKTLKSEAIKVKADILGFVRCCCKKPAISELSPDEVLLGDEFLVDPDGRLLEDGTQLPPLDSEDLEAPSGVSPPPTNAAPPSAPEPAPAPGSQGVCAPATGNRLAATFGGTAQDHLTVDLPLDFSKSLADGFGYSLSGKFTIGRKASFWSVFTFPAGSTQPNGSGHGSATEPSGIISGSSGPLGQAMVPFNPDGSFNGRVQLNPGSNIAETLFMIRFGDGALGAMICVPCGGKCQPKTD